MIAIIDYNAGNLTSVKLALDALEVPARITNEPSVIADAERVVFPGVGAAGAAMADIDRLNLRDAIIGAAQSGKPFLGICLGTQILLDASEEDDGTPCLSLIPGQVVRFQPDDKYDKIPQIGWNTVQFRSPAHPLFAGIEDNSEFYFVHSFYPSPTNQANWLAETTYAGATFASAVGKGNVVATQFHPERSGRIGLRLLKNFTEWDGSC